MKKAFLVFLAVVMLVSVTACAKPGNAGGSNPGSSQGGGAGNNNPGKAAEPYTVKLRYMTMLTIPSDEATKQVIDAINNHLDEIGATDIRFDMDFTSLFEYGTQIGLELAGGQAFDLLYCADFANFIENGYIVPLDKYMDTTLADAAEVCGDWLACTTVNGSVYGLPAHKGAVLTYKYCYDTQYINGIGYDMSKIKDFYDLEDMYAKLKAAYPDKIIDAMPYAYLPILGAMQHVSQVGTFAATVENSTELVNYFATDTFKEAAEYAFRFKNLGYTLPEGANTAQNCAEICFAGLTVGTLMGHAYTEQSVGEIFDVGNTYGGKWAAKEVQTTLLTNIGLYYGISYTSKNTDAAAKMLNLLWTDEFIINALIYGLENVSWVWNEDHTAITYPEGQNMTTVPFTCIYNCGAFSDQFSMYPFLGNTSADDMVYAQHLIDTAFKVPTFGFTPNNSEIATQLAACSNVQSEYYNSFTYGDIDPDEYLPKFLSELTAAGVETVIADYQRQVNEWLKY